MTRTLTAALLALALVSPAIALAQPPESAAAAAIPPIPIETAQPIASAASREATRQALGRQPRAFSGATPHRQRGVGRKILGGVAGGVAGFFGGGYLGAAIEGDRCNCDDPGVKGFLIGAPVGAVAGAILGATFF